VRIEGIVATAARVSFDIIFERPALTVLASSAFDAQLGETSVSHRLAATGGSPPYRWRALDPLPNGLRLTTDGVIEGNAETLAQAQIRLEVSDAGSSITTAQVDVRVSMPALTLQQALRSVTQPTTLDALRQRALDLLGNRNGRVDIGDVVRFREWSRNSAVNSASAQ
jgi:hypothetical protein